MHSTNQPVLKGRLKGDQIRRLSRLIDMLYTPSEIAAEVGFTRRQVYRAYLPLGCPHERDETGHVWINGVAFREWYQSKYKKINLAPDEGYCLACKKVISLQKPKIKQVDHYKYFAATCPICGRKVSKAITNKK